MCDEVKELMKYFIIELNVFLGIPPMTCSSSGSCILQSGGNPCKTMTDCLASQSCQNNMCFSSSGGSNGTTPTGPFCYGVYCPSGQSCYNNACVTSVPPPNNGTTNGTSGGDNPFMLSCNSDIQCASIPGVPAGITFKCNNATKYCYLPCGGANSCPSGNGEYSRDFL